MRRFSPVLRYTPLIALIVLAMAILPPEVHAQGNPAVIPSDWNVIPANPNNPLATKICSIKTGWISSACIPEFIGHLIATVFSVISAFFLINVIYAGYQMAMGSWTGDKANGKDRLTWSIIGLVVCVCAFLILDLVVSVITP